MSLITGLGLGFTQSIRKNSTRAGLRFVKMALQLLHEASLREASRLAAYVGALPCGAALDTPLQWRPEELAALRYPFLQAEADAHLDNEL